MCDICDVIGIKPINSGGASSAAKRLKKSRPTNVNFNFGNNVSHIDRSLAKEELLKRYDFKCPDK